MKICAFEDCKIRVFSHGYCNGHQYKRLDPDYMRKQEQKRSQVGEKAKIKTEWKVTSTKMNEGKATG